MVYVGLGPTTLNLPTDLPLADIATIPARRRRPRSTANIEGADDFAAPLRYHELTDIVAGAAPVDLKFGLRNAAGIYPSGTHVPAAVIATARERVRLPLSASTHCGVPEWRTPGASSSPIRTPGRPSRTARGTWSPRWPRSPPSAPASRSSSSVNVPSGARSNGRVASRPGMRPCSRRGRRGRRLSVSTSLGDAHQADRACPR